jgi:hypothetical protein
LETYIIRIYRRGKSIPHKLIGIVEETGIEGKKAFTCADELWNILKSPEKAISQKHGKPKNKEGYVDY